MLCRLTWRKGSAEKCWTRVGPHRAFLHLSSFLLTRDRAPSRWRQVLSCHPRAVFVWLEELPWHLLDRIPRRSCTISALLHFPHTLLHIQSVHFEAAQWQRLPHPQPATHARMCRDASEPRHYSSGNLTKGQVDNFRHSVAVVRQDITPSATFFQSLWMCALVRLL